MNIVRQLTVIITTIFALVMNAAASILPLNGRSTGEISDSLQVLFVPAGYVFSIWGLIYIGLIAYTFYHSLPGRRQDPLMIRTGWLVALSSLANGIWIIFWHLEQFLVTVLVMLILLSILMVLYVSIYRQKSPLTQTQKWLVAIPFSLYLGWITVATIANITAFLGNLGWRGGAVGEIGWTLIMLTAGVGIAAAIAFTRSDIAYLLVLVWAFVGISVKWAELMPLNWAGFLAAGIVLVLLVVSRFRKNPQAMVQR